MNRAGFSLAEVIVAMTLVCVAGLGVAATGLVAVQSFARAEQQERLLQEAELVLDSLLLLPRNTAGTRFLPQAQIRWIAADSTEQVVVQGITAGGIAFELPGVR